MSRSRRVLAILGALAAAAAADGVRSEFWAVAIEDPGFRKTVAMADPNAVLAGRLAGVEIVVRVHETDRLLDAKGWRKKIRKELGNDKDESVQEGDEPRPWFAYEKTRLGVFTEHTAHAFYVRGYHCFEVVAKTEDDANALRKALASLRVDPDPGCSVVASRLTPPGEARTFLRAARDYARRGHPLARTMLARAAKLDTRPSSLEAKERWELHELGGQALLQPPEPSPAEAMAWFAKAEAAAAKLEEDAAEHAARSAYGLARAASLAGKLDEAFAALDRAYVGPGKPVTDGQVSNDKDLEPLRRDPRWHEFWRKRVKADR